MPLRIKPRDKRFFDLFRVAGDNVVSAVTVLGKFVGAPAEQRVKLANAGDDATHVIVVDRSTGDLAYLTNDPPTPSTTGPDRPSSQLVCGHRRLLDVGYCRPAGHRAGAALLPMRQALDARRREPARTCWSH